MPSMSFESSFRVGSRRLRFCGLRARNWQPAKASGEASRRMVPYTHRAETQTKSLPGIASAATGGRCSARLREVPPAISIAAGLRELTSSGSGTAASSTVRLRCRSRRHREEGGFSCVSDTREASRVIG